MLSNLLVGHANHTKLRSILRVHPLLKMELGSKMSNHKKASPAIQTSAIKQMTAARRAASGSPLRPSVIFSAEPIENGIFLYTLLSAETKNVPSM